MDPLDDYGHAGYCDYVGTGSEGSPDPHNVGKDLYAEVKEVAQESIAGLSQLDRMISDYKQELIAIRSERSQVQESLQQLNGEKKKWETEHEIHELKLKMLAADKAFLTKKYYKVQKEDRPDIVKKVREAKLNRLQKKDEVEKYQKRFTELREDMRLGRNKIEHIFQKAKIESNRLHALMKLHRSKQEAVKRRRDRRIQETELESEIQEMIAVNSLDSLKAMKVDLEKELASLRDQSKSTEKIECVNID